MPDTTVRVEYIGAVQNFSEVTITGNQQVWRIGSSAFVETSRASQLVASGKFRSLANDPAMLPSTQSKIGAITSDGGIDKFDFARRTGAVAVVHSLGADSIGAAITTAQRLDYAKIPAGSLQVGDVIRVTHARTKSGATDTSSAVLRAGSQNAVSDGVLASLPGLATTATSAGTIMEFKITSATTMRQLGTTNGNTSMAGTSTGAIYADKSIPNIASADLFIGLYDTMTSGSEYVTLGTFSVEYIPQVL